MAEFAVNPQRFDPYKSFKFRLKWDGRYVAGVTKVSALKRSVEVTEYREGGDASTSHKSPGRMKYEAITLERGVTEDTAFADWAGEVWAYSASLGSETSLADFRKDVFLEFLDDADRVVVSYKIFRCWPSEYAALPDLDASGAAVVLETIKLENEGFERDTSARASPTPPPPRP
ncbi:MAG: phage tail protein [Caulobacteraceae bacterium]